MFAGEFVKWVKLLAVLQKSIFYYNVEWAEVCKWGFLSKYVLSNEWSFLVVLVGFENFC